MDTDSNWGPFFGLRWQSTNKTHHSLCHYWELEEPSECRHFLLWWYFLHLSKPVLPDIQHTHSHRRRHATSYLCLPPWKESSHLHTANLRRWHNTPTQISGKRTESHRTKSHKTPRTKSHRTKSHNLYFLLWRTKSHNMYTLIHVCIILLCIVLKTDRDIVSGSFCCFKLYYSVSYQLAVWYMLFLKYSLFKTSSLLQDEEQ